MGRIVFVIGLPASGKSYFIKENFPDAKVIDIFNYQNLYDTYIDTVDSYMEVCKDLIHEITLNEEYNQGQDTIVLEHTLVKTYRRPLYLQAIQAMCGHYDLTIDCYYTLPTAKQYTEMWYRRQSMDLDMMFNYRVQESERMIKQFEIPIVEEGFNSVTQIECEM